jgi:hypothetical protein
VAAESELVPVENIEQKIYLIRGQKVMLSHDLARMYGVEVRALSQAVTRNAARFPEDFMFQLNAEETRLLQATAPGGRGHHPKYRPHAFTEQGVAMLSAVLRSLRAIQVSIAIIRVFVRLRQLMSTHQKLVRRLNDLESKYDGQFQAVFQAIRALMNSDPVPPSRRIGFLKD